MINQVVVATVKPFKNYLKLAPIGSVAFFVSSNLYQGNHGINYKLWNIGSTETYTPYAGELLHTNGEFTMEKLK